MLVSSYRCIAFLLALEGAVAAVAGLSPFFMWGRYPATLGRLYKRDIEHTSQESKEGEDSHSNVTGRTPTNVIGHPPISVIGHPPTTDIDDEDDITTDYDFVMDLDKEEDFDRLLNMLSRSGPAKPLHEETAAPSSTFLDRHDELEHPSPHLHSSLAPSYLPHGTKYTPQKVDPHAEGSHFDDLEKERKEAEQRNLEELYFNQVKGKRGGSSEEENDHWHGALHNSVDTLSVWSPSVSLAGLLIIFCLI